MDDSKNVLYVGFLAQISLFHKQNVLFYGPSRINPCLYLTSYNLENHICNGKYDILDKNYSRHPTYRFVFILYFSWLGCSPLVLEQKILQFSAALFIIEKFADYSEEAGFTQVHTGKVFLRLTFLSGI